MEILAGLTPELAKLPRLQPLKLWQEILPALVASPRRGLLQDLCSLMPVINELGGPEGFIETNKAVGEVGKWWP